MTNNIVSTTKAWFFETGDLWESLGKQVEILEFRYPDRYHVRVGTEFSVQYSWYTTQNIKDLTRSMTQVRVAGLSVTPETIYQLLNQLEGWKNMADAYGPDCPF